MAIRHQKKNIVIIGAGVSGLTTALLLSKNTQYEITVAAKSMPGDYDIEYASPWAGADYVPFSTPGAPAQKWERNTWPYLKDLAQNHLEAGIHFRSIVLYSRSKDSESSRFASNPWFQELFPDFHHLESSELPENIEFAYSFTSVCINTALYLPWLLSQCLKAGVIVKRAIFNHVSEAATSHHSGAKADLVVNCTGLSSLKLGGVMDQTMTPIRGQIVVVRNEPELDFAMSGTEDGPEEVAYLMCRAAGGGTILGGCTQKGNWESQPDLNLAQRIMKRCLAIRPDLVEEGQGVEHLSIVRHAVGLRPFREGGVRIESEVIDGSLVVHNYGHAGFGYQASYGCAEDVVSLIEEAFSF